MKNMNINTILLLALSTFMMNGCVVKSQKSNPSHIINGFVKNKVHKGSWKNVSNVNKKDCVNCYATPIRSKRVVSRVLPLRSSYSRVPKYTFKKIDYSKLPSVVTISKNKPINTLHYDSYDYTMTENDTHIKSKTYQKLYKNNYSISKTAIQIGAFRKYAGAEIYARKYNALSSKYNVTIKTGVKNRHPLHRVRIEGFSNRVEAKNFMARYGITEGFLVRR